MTELDRSIQAERLANDTASALQLFLSSMPTQLVNAALALFVADIEVRRKADRLLSKQPPPYHILMIERDDPPEVEPINLGAAFHVEAEVGIDAGLSVLANMLFEKMAEDFCDMLIPADIDPKVHNLMPIKPLTGDAQVHVKLKRVECSVGERETLGNPLHKRNQNMIKCGLEIGLHIVSEA